MPEMMTVRAPIELRDFLDVEAKRLGMGRNALILQVLWEWTQKNDRYKPLKTKKLRNGGQNSHD